MIINDNLENILSELKSTLTDSEIDWVVEEDEKGKKFNAIINNLRVDVKEKEIAFSIARDDGTVVKKISSEKGRSKLFEELCKRIDCDEDICFYKEAMGIITEYMNPVEVEPEDAESEDDEDQTDIEPEEEGDQDEPEDRGHN